MMSRCLRDRTLLELVAGEGTASQRTHLVSCQSCTTRYQRAVHNFDIIERTLLTTNPPATTPMLQAPLLLWWVPVAATLAGIVILSWAGLWRLPVRVSQPAPSAVQHEEIYTFFDDTVAPALFTATEMGQSQFSSSLAFGDRSSVFDDGWPCEEGELFASLGCEPMSSSSEFEEF